MKRTTLPRVAATATLTFILLVLFVQAAQAEVPFDPPGKYSTSWLGNTYMDVNGHKNVTEELAGLCLSPNGKLYSAGYAETWGGGASHNAADGSLLGTLRQNVNGWKGSDGQVDAAYGMTVHPRKNGEYIVLFENAAWANIQMYRWQPGGPRISNPTAPAEPKHETSASDNAEASPGYVTIFSDDTIKQWRQCGPGRFVVTNGVATGEGGMGLWWYAGRQFTNFVLRGEFVQEQEIADSGVFLRFPDPGQDPWVAVHQGHEMEIGDPAPQDPTWRTGSIYPFAASARANTKPLGQWNTFEITCNGQEYTVRINDDVVTRWTDPQARTAHGFIGLQNYNDHKTVRHRNLRIQELP